MYAPCHLFVTRVYTTFVYNVIASYCAITPCMASLLRIASSLRVRRRCFVLRHHSVYDAVASYCVITPCMTSLTSYCFIAASSFVSSRFAWYSALSGLSTFPTRCVPVCDFGPHGRSRVVQNRRPAHKYHPTRRSERVYNYMVNNNIIILSLRVFFICHGRFCNQFLKANSAGKEFACPYHGYFF